MAGTARRATTLIFLMVSMSCISLVSGADSDGDGVDDSIDDCPFAPGNSTVDRDGCPDRDGDGTSDSNDGWTSIIKLKDMQKFSKEKKLIRTTIYIVSPALGNFKKASNLYDPNYEHLFRMN